MEFQEALDYLEANNVYIKTKFVPFHLSRNKENKLKNLNWIVTLFKDEKEVAEIKYSAGQAHCPSYRQNPKDKHLNQRLIDCECENGVKCGLDIGGRAYKKINGKRIEPKLLDVMNSVILDAECLDFEDFEDWAENFGYDLDSRKSEKLYNSCLKTSLLVLNRLGPKFIKTFKTLMEDY